VVTASGAGLGTGLGTGQRLTVTTLSSEAGRSSSYLVRWHGKGLLVDAGPGALRALDHHGGLSAVDGIVVSHGHADHCLDLTAIAYARRFPDPDPEPLPLWLPAGTVPVLEALDDIFGVPTLEAMRRPIAQSFEVIPLSTRVPTMIELWERLSLTPFPAKHAVPCAAIRLQTPAGTVVFSGDTGYHHPIIAAADSADAFFCEATYLHASAGELDGHGHLTAALAGRLASEATAHRLVLSHLSRLSDAPQAMADASRHYPCAPIDLAARNTTITIG
jgi:ribonuclease BN (tRNA processing enzyme)